LSKSPSPLLSFAILFNSSALLHSFLTIPYYASYTPISTSGKDGCTSDQVREDTYPCHSETEHCTTALQAKTVVHQRYQLPLPPTIYYSVCPSILSLDTSTSSKLINRKEPMYPQFQSIFYHHLFHSPNNEWGILKENTKNQFVHDGIRGI
jgi:hypothetical protein